MQPLLWSVFQLIIALTAIGWCIAFMISFHKQAWKGIGLEAVAGPAVATIVFDAIMAFSIVWIVHIIKHLPAVYNAL